MKQVQITTSILDRLKKAVGADVEASNYAVFEATALNTRAVRKNHPLYKGARHTPDFLSQMSVALANESLPLQIMHNTDPLPIGRVFHGEVLTADGETELRSLFWVDAKAHPDHVLSVDNGTVDQVSVSVLPKSAKCNLCGFDFLGPKATFDNIWSGTCPDDHVMGEGAAHAVLDGLDTWFEMSLVGKGGIPGAKITSRENSHFSDARLAASGLDAQMLTLNLTSQDLSEQPAMNLKEFTDTIAENAVKLSAAESAKAALEAKVAELTATNLALTTKVSELTAASATVPDKDKKITDLEAEVSELSTVVIDTTKHVLGLKGDATTEVKSAKEALPLLKATTAAMKLSFAGAGSQPADANGNRPVLRASAAFKSHAK